MKYITDIHETDAAGIKLLAQASIQAYNAFDSDHPTRCRRGRVSAPDGFELIDCWSGVDAIFGHDRTVEIYGLVFRSTAPPWRYVFAFRGTDSVLDVLDDLGVETTAFVPCDPSASVPHHVHVEAGFSGIYRTSDGSVESMQHQLFALVDKYLDSDKPIAELLVTGHSLGAALSQIFTLDVALSRPDVPTRNINFASPRVGNGAFVRFYQQSVKGPDTVRVQNMYDAVPHVPPADTGFEHLPVAYVIAFYRDDWYGKLELVDCHSSLNYSAVADCAAAKTEGLCVARRMKVPGQTYRIRSEAPDLVAYPSLDTRVEPVPDA